MLDLQSEIRAAIDNFDFERARELLREPLQNPTSEILHLAAMAAINDQQCISFLQKALELDATDNYAINELARLGGTVPLTLNPDYLPASVVSQMPLSVQKKKRWKWFWMLAGLLVLVLGAGAVAIISLNAKSTVAGFDLPTKTIVLPTVTPAGPKLIAPAYQCLPAVYSNQDTTFRAEACINEKERKPNQGTTVKVYGRLIVDGKLIDNYLMNTYWDFLFLPDQQSDVPNSNGITVAAYNLGAFTTPNYPVTVYVTFDYNGIQRRIATTNTTFVPQSR